MIRVDVIYQNGGPLRWRVSAWANREVPRSPGSAVPMLATLGRAPFDDPGWVYEVKFLQPSNVLERHEIWGGP